MNRRPSTSRRSAITGPAEAATQSDLGRALRCSDARPSSGPWRNTRGTRTERTAVSGIALKPEVRSHHDQRPPFGARHLTIGLTLGLVEIGRAETLTRSALCRPSRYGDGGRSSAQCIWRSDDVASRGIRSGERGPRQPRRERDRPILTGGPEANQPESDRSPRSRESRIPSGSAWAALVPSRSTRQARPTRARLGLHGRLGSSPKLTLTATSPRRSATRQAQSAMRVRMTRLAMARWAREKREPDPVPWR